MRVLERIGWGSDVEIRCDVWVGLWVGDVEEDGRGFGVVAMFVCDLDGDSYSIGRV